MSWVLMDFNGMRWWGGFLFGIDCGAICFFDKPAPTALMMLIFDGCLISIAPQNLCGFAQLMGTRHRQG
jgi:hypothetical protein